jgi:hypothetical protein
MMASRENLMLRGPRQRRLEGRTPLIQRLCRWCSSNLGERQCRGREQFLRRDLPFVDPLLVRVPGNGG